MGPAVTGLSSERFQGEILVESGFHEVFHAGELVAGKSRCLRGDFYRYNHAKVQKAHRQRSGESFRIDCSGWVAGIELSNQRLHQQMYRLVPDRRAEYQPFRTDTFHVLSDSLDELFVEGTVHKFGWRHQAHLRDGAFGNHRNLPGDLSHKCGSRPG